MSIGPLHGRILARRLAEKDQTVGGPFILANAEEEPLEAAVVSVGSGKLLEGGKTLPRSARPGAQVLIDENGQSFTPQNATRLALCGGGVASKKRFWYAGSRSHCPPQSEQMLEAPRNEGALADWEGEGGRLGAASGNFQRA